jgi:hypothetical protein
MLSGSFDNTLQLWEVPSSGRCQRTFSGHTGSVCAVCFSGDGSWALSGSADTTVRLWEVATGHCIRTFEGHTNTVTGVALSPDGRWALTGSDDTTLKLWELEWELQPHDPADWDERAAAHLDTFLTRQTPYGTQLEPAGQPSEATLVLALSRRGQPAWSPDDFQQLLHFLACAGLGWLRPEGVRRELERRAAHWQGAPPIPVFSHPEHTLVTCPNPKCQAKLAFVRCLIPMLRRCVYCGREVVVNASEP